jgi:hypothetical protein
MSKLLKLPRSSSKGEQLDSGVFKNNNEVAQALKSAKKIAAENYVLQQELDRLKKKNSPPNKQT